jgi:hypothetical protein
MLADQFNDTMRTAWEQLGGANAITTAQKLGAELHPVKGGCTIAEFMDGSFALLANHGQSIEATWLEQDTETTTTPPTGEPL